MSSNIKVKRICLQCGEEFIARTTVTKYCSDNCAKRAYKANLRAEKIQASNQETHRTRIKPIEELKAKEYLTVRDVATLLNSSLRTIYRLIDQRNIKAINLAKRKTLVKRSDLDRLFTDPEPHMSADKLELDQEKTDGQVRTRQFDIANSYSLPEILSKYHISGKALNELIKLNGIPKIKIGWDSYLPMADIDKLLNQSNLVEHGNKNQNQTKEDFRRQT